MSGSTWQAFMVMLNSAVAARRWVRATSAGMVAASAGVKNCATAFTTKISRIMAGSWRAGCRRVAARSSSVRATRAVLQRSKTRRVLMRSTNTPATPLTRSCASRALTVMAATKVFLPVVAVEAT